MALRDAQALVEPHEQRRLAQKVLDLLLVLCRSGAGAVFRVGGGSTAALHASHGVEQKLLDWAAADWRHAEVAAPILHEGRSFLYLPCSRDGVTVGFAYLECERGAAPPGSRVHVLLELLTDATAPTPAEAAERDGRERTERERLLYLLHHHEWNISRVARIEGVTRKTVYERLQRYGIPRQRVRLKPRPA